MIKQRVNPLWKVHVYLVYLVCIHYVYLPILHLLGPRCAIILSRAWAWLHWLCTFVGVQRRPLRVLREILPTIQPELGARAILRRNIRLKHRVFVEQDCCRTARGRRYLQQSYQLEGRERLDAAINEGHGVIVLTFHVGTSQEPLFAVLQMQGYDIMLHRFPGGAAVVAALGAAPGGVAPGCTRTLNGAVRAIISISKAAETYTGPVLYHSPDLAFSIMLRRLRRGGLVVISGDGMASTDFLEVPFLGGTIRLPMGPAQLAAHSGAAIVCVFAMPEGLSRHRVIIHPPLYCREDSTDAVRETMTAYVAVWEDYVRREPWAWWSWGRVLVQRHGDGRLRLDLRAPPMEAGFYKQFRQGPALRAGAAVTAGPIPQQRSNL